jgi:hypothetical protein
LTPGGSSTVHTHTNNTQNGTYLTIKRKKLGSVGRVPSLELYPGICLTTEEKTKKNLRVVEKCPSILVAAVQYTFTHKEYST